MKLPSLTSGLNWSVYTRRERGVGERTSPKSSDLICEKTELMMDLVQRSVTRIYEESF